MPPALPDAESGSLRRNEGGRRCLFCALSADMFKKDQHMVKAEPGFSDQAAVLCADINSSLEKKKRACLEKITLKSAGQNGRPGNFWFLKVFG